MRKYTELDCKELDGNVFDLIGNRWLLITVNDSEKKRVNVMTASWGTMGVLWNKNVCTLFVRLSRHSCDLIEAADTFSVAVLSGDSKQAYGICGKMSGRDTDKVAKCGLTAGVINGVPVIEESDYIFTLKKLYSDDIKRERFIDGGCLSCYTDGDFHRVYVCEITGVYRSSEKN